MTLCGYRPVSADTGVSVASWPPPRRASCNAEAHVNGDVGLRWAFLAGGHPPARQDGAGHHGVHGLSYPKRIGASHQHDRGIQGRPG